MNNYGLFGALGRGSAGVFRSLIRADSCRQVPPRTGVASWTPWLVWAFGLDSRHVGDYDTVSIGFNLPLGRGLRVDTLDMPGCAAGGIRGIRHGAS